MTDEIKVAVAAVRLALAKLETAVEAERVACYRAGYGDGGDAYVLEMKGKPFLVEDEALAAWQLQSAGSALRSFHA